MEGRIIREKEKNHMPIIGKIKCGEKIERNGKEMPVSYDYFIADGNYKDLFDKKFDKPKKLDIVFISNEIKESCFEYMEIRQGTKLFASGNGREFKVYDKKTDRYIIRTVDQEPDLINQIKIECNAGLAKGKKPAEFDEILTLYFLIIGISEVFGVWKFQTKGRESSIPSIVKSFDTTYQMAGFVRFIPFTLSVEKAKSQKPGSKNSFPVVSLTANIGQEHLEKVQTHMDDFLNFRGILTQDKIENAIKEIEYIETEEIEINIEKLKENLNNCESMEQLKEVTQEIQSLVLTDEQKKELREIYDRKSREFEKGVSGSQSETGGAQ